MKQKSKNLIIYGDSSYAEMIAHYFQTDSEYKVVAFCVDRAYQSKDEIGSIPVVALEEIEEHFSIENHYIFAAIGYKSMRVHKTLFQKITQLSYPIASYVSSQAIVDVSSKVARNCLVLAGAILEPETVIEENCFINSGAIVCHHSTIKAHCVLAAGSLVGGYTTIGENSLIGFKATVAEVLNVAPETLLGAASLLLADTKSCTMYVGTPANEHRTHHDTGIMIVPTNLK